MSIMRVESWSRLLVGIVEIVCTNARRLAGNATRMRILHSRRFIIALPIARFEGALTCIFDEVPFAVVKSASDATSSRDHLKEY